MYNFMNLTPFLIVTENLIQYTDKLTSCP